MRPAATALAAAVLMFTLGAAPAAAQPVCPGHITATALRPVPADAVFGIALMDDGDTQRMFRDRLIAALRQAGRRVGDPPGYLLSWRGGIGAGDGAPTPGFSTADRLFNQPSAFRDSDDMHWMRDVPRQPSRGAGAPPPPPPPTLRISGRVELREREGGHVVWTALVSCERRGTDPQRLATELAAAVVPAIGETLAARPF